MLANSRIPYFVFPSLLIACLLVILVPLPPLVLDLLITINIAVAVLILLTTVFVDSPIEFSVFPTVLLSATLGRLVLNVATTRLILANAHTDGLSAAGGIVQGFGEFVTGGEIAVGLIMFVIIVLIQFLVVTKGATRISEVAARFALDGMPGRQMAIDADVAAGNMTAQQGSKERELLRESADFYGAMDGASKFVRGDAIAGLAITGINILGGLYLGLKSGMSLSEAAGIYTRLTIGDGLVSQIPAFLVALAAGLLITRSSKRTQLPIELLRQLLKRPEPLVVSAVLLGFLVFTRLPAVPLLLVGGVMAGFAFVLSRTPAMFDEEQNDAAEPQETQREDTVEDLLSVNALELEIGVGLLRLADPARGGDLMERITRLRHQIAVEVGIVMPRVRIRDNLQLEEYAYRMKVFDNVVADGTVYPLRLLATFRGPLEQKPMLPGVRAEHPVSGLPASWIDPGQKSEADRLGFQFSSAVEVIVDHLRETVDRHAGDLLNRDATSMLVEQVRQRSPAVVEELLPDKLGLGELQRILHNLLDERVPIRNLPVILETLCDVVGHARDPVELTEHVRERLARTISSSLVTSNGQMFVVTLNPDWEQRLMMANRLESRGSYPHHSFVHLPVTEKRQLINDIRDSSRAIPEDRPLVLLVRTELRSFVRSQIAVEMPHLHVISYREITSDVEIRSAGVIGSAELAA